MAVIRPARGRARLYQAHPRGAEARRALLAGEWEWGLAVRATVAGVGLAGFLLALPLVGAVACAAFGLDPMAGVR